MSNPSSLWKLFHLLILCFFFSGCGQKHVDFTQLDALPREEEVKPERATSLPKKPSPAPAKAVPPTGWTVRTISEKEILKLSRKDPDLTMAACLEMLARLNIKDRDYIKEDIKKGRKIKVPNDFAAFKRWTPLPRTIPNANRIRKLILVAKDIPFIGWYDWGRLVGDTHICIGKEWSWTKKGSYTVLEKDPYHISKSYTNAYGTPALMPMALRIYGHVWIHAGDVIGGYCSHGCINLPLDPADKLYNWAEVGTNVIILDALKELDKDLKGYLERIPNSPPPTHPPVKGGIKSDDRWRDIY